jgi:hypothetical protein
MRATNDVILPFDNTLCASAVNVTLLTFKARNAYSS